MLETKCVADNFKMLVTILAILVTDILYLLKLAIFKILILSPTFLDCHQHHNVTIMTVAHLDHDLGPVFNNKLTRQFCLQKNLHRQKELNFRLLKDLQKVAAPNRREFR